MCFIGKLHTQRLMSFGDLPEYPSLASFAGLLKDEMYESKGSKHHHRGVNDSLHDDDDDGEADESQLLPSLLADLPKKVHHTTVLHHASPVHRFWLPCPRLIDLLMVCPHLCSVRC